MDLVDAIAIATDWYEYNLGQEVSPVYVVLSVRETLGGDTFYVGDDTTNQAINMVLAADRRELADALESD